MSKHDIAMDLLRRAAEHMEEAPDVQWWKQYLTLKGDHMICTEEGWESGENKQSYLDEGEPILDEVCAPE